jgi:ATP-dependent DNA helicase RecG
MSFLSSVEEIKGVGPKTATALKKYGFETIKDLAYYFPRSYEDYQRATAIRDLEPGKVIVKGKIKDLTVKYTRRRNFNIASGIVYDGTGEVRVVWYNQPYRVKAFKENAEYYFSGNYDFKFNRYQLTSPTVNLAAEVEETKTTFQPIYSTKGSYKSLWFKKLFDEMQTEIAKAPDMLPYVKEGTRAEALYNIHFPDNYADVEKAKEYLAYEELFELILAAKLNKNENSKLKAEPLKFVAENTKEFVEKLPFKLTNGQRLAAWDILKDMEKPEPMNRLLQGDVGSGKTVVAAIAIYQAFKAGKQSALLAPTAILATQHAKTLKNLLEPFGVKVELLIGATKKKDDLKERIKNGEVDVVVGTHAIITDDTKFNDLCFAIIDEQHRFGVMQRQKLLAKTGEFAPHLLAMTATPIPRSLQLTIFGDLSVSTISELPKGRTPIKTKLINELSMSEDLYPEMVDHMNAGEQIYWICKLIEETGRSEAANVKKEADKLKLQFPNRKIEYLHGRMKPDEKDEIMNRFKDGKIDILVSTTVVEVGVDVPNATTIVIMDAEGFGLAQLHQLRGRVGRGEKESKCFLVVKDDKEPSMRLKELEKSTDGFHLAEVDLKLRGPGEIYGQLQHGALNLKIATLSDTRTIAKAQRAAEEFAKNPENMLKYEELKSEIKKYQQLTTLN